MSAGSIPGGTNDAWFAREAARLDAMAPTSGIPAPTPSGGRNGARAGLQRQHAQRADWLVLDSYRAAVQETAVCPALHSACVNSTPRIVVWEGARKARVRLPDPHAGDKARWRAAQGIQRGKVMGFSEASRRRLMEQLAEVLRDSVLPIFVTLTLPREWKGSWSEAKALLRAIVKRWKRRHQSVAVLWKMEPQADGTPHFHLLLWGTGFLPWQEVAIDWAEIVSSRSLGRDYPMHPKLFRQWLDKAAEEGQRSSCGDMGVEIARKVASAGTRVEAIRTWRGVMSYTAKYLSKAVDYDDADGWPGRWWGWEGKANAPLAQPVTQMISAECAYRVIRYLRRELRKKHGWLPFIERTLKIFSERPEDLWCFLRNYL